MIEPLKLTQEHKDKLLEMCRKLFPEYNDNIFIDDDCGFVTDFHLSEQNTYTQTINIHWFEFCMTHLADKILDDDREYNEGRFPSTLEYFRGSVCYRLNKDAHANEIANYNPVDYLYKEFLKLKDDTKIT